MKIIRENDLMKIAEEMVNTHAFAILKELGLSEENDGILSRIAVSDVANQTMVTGYFTHQMLAKGPMGIRGCEYVKGSGSITLNPRMLIHSISKKGLLVRMPFSTLFLTLFRTKLHDALVFVLAHEIRHYWQYYTNIVFTKGDYVGSTHCVPYQYRWEERDANQWASQYLESTKKARTKKTMKGGETVAHHEGNACL